MKRRWLTVVGTVALAVVTATSGCAGANRSSVDDAGHDRAPRFVASDLSTHEQVSSQQLKGRPAMLVAWATWCGACRAELPALQRFYEDLPRRSPLQVVAVDLEAGGASYEVRKAVYEAGLTMPVWQDARDSFRAGLRGVRGSGHGPSRCRGGGVPRPAWRARRDRPVGTRLAASARRRSRGGLTTPHPDGAPTTD